MVYNMMTSFEPTTLYHYYYKSQGICMEQSMINRKKTRAYQPCYLIFFTHLRPGNDAKLTDDRYWHSNVY